MQMKVAGPASSMSDKAAGSNSVAVKCRPLVDMLKEVGRQHVDFWSLDVEGFEMEVLGTIAWDRLSFGAILIEDFWLSQRHVDYKLTMQWFMKYQQMSIDSLYVPKGSM